MNKWWCIYELVVELRLYFYKEVLCIIKCFDVFYKFLIIIFGIND